MQQDFLKSFNEFSKNAMEAAKSLAEINSKLVEQTIKQQMKAADLFFESSVKQAKLVQEKKEVKDLMAEQSALVEEYTGKFVELAKANVNLAQQAGTEYKAWIEKGLKEADSTAKSVAKKAVSAAA